MTGRVCPKHEEWCPTGECRWCAPPELFGLDTKHSQWRPPAIWNPCACGTVVGMPTDPAYFEDDPSRFWRHSVAFCGPPGTIHIPVVVHYPACAQNPCTCTSPAVVSSLP